MKLGLLNTYKGIILFEPDNSGGGWDHLTSEHMCDVKTEDINFNREDIKKWVKEGNHSIGIYAPYWLAKFYSEECRPGDVYLKRKLKNLNIDLYEGSDELSVEV